MLLFYTRAVIVAGAFPIATSDVAAAGVLVIVASWLMTHLHAGKEMSIPGDVRFGIERRDRLTDCMHT